MSRIFILDNRRFLFKETLIRNWVFSKGNMIYFLDGEDKMIPLGLSMIPGDDIRLIREYFRVSFCKDLRSEEPYPWHIRILDENERIRGKSESLSLCGDIPFSSLSDLTIPVSLQQENVCEKCAWEWWYRQGYDFDTKDK